MRRERDSTSDGGAGLVEAVRRLQRQRGESILSAGVGATGVRITGVGVTGVGVKRTLGGGALISRHQA